MRQGARDGGVAMYRMYGMRQGARDDSTATTGCTCDHKETETTV